jgi:hypothetical protein
LFLGAALIALLLGMLVLGLVLIAVAVAVIGLPVTTLLQSVEGRLGLSWRRKPR